MQEKVRVLTWKSILKVILQVIFVLVVFFFLGKALLINWNKIDIDLTKLNYYYLALSFVLFTAALVGYALCWNETVDFLGNRLKTRRAIKIWYWSQASRYIPGSVWSIFGRIYFGGKEGISKGKVVASIAIESSMLIISSVIVYAFSLPFSKNLRDISIYWPYFIVGICFFAFLYPPFFNKVTDFFVHRIDKTIEFKTNLPLTEILKLLSYYILVWIVFGLAFFSLLNALKTVSLVLLPVSIGVFALSWVLGFLFIIAPGGLGAREVAIIFMLSVYFSRPTAIVAAILSRLLMLFSEGLILVVSSKF